VRTMVRGRKKIPKNVAPWNGNVCIYRGTRFEEREVLIEQTQFIGSNSKMLRFPGGKASEIEGVDKDPFDTAVREVREETGLIFDDTARVCFVERKVLDDGHFQDYFAVPFEDFKGELNCGPHLVDGEKLVSYFWMPLLVAVIPGRLSGNHSPIALALEDALTRAKYLDELSEAHADIA
jgi:8-oxo-dGTP pyrophosphatase MutT (NUDIX family)